MNTQPLFNLTHDIWDEQHHSKVEGLIEYNIGSQHREREWRVFKIMLRCDRMCQSRVDDIYTPTFLLPSSVFHTRMKSEKCPF